MSELNPELSRDDILDVLNAPDEPVKEDLLKKEVEEPVKKTSEEEEEEKVTEPEEEVKIEEVEPEPEIITHARRKEILAKYPTIFKDFPFLEKSYFREQKYAELLPTLDDAREAVERSETLKKFEGDLLNGNSESVLQSVLAQDKESFAKIVDNYLPTLARVDSNAYYHVIGNVIKNTIVAMAQESQRLQNEQLKDAAILLNQFIFGNSQFTPPTTFGKPGSSEPNELQQERAKFNQERFEAARGDLSTRVTNLIKSTIDTNIDPKELMSSYIKKNAVRDCFEEVDKVLADDKRFRSIMDRLWKQASESNYSQGSIEKIRSAWLSAAKTVLPQLIQKSRNDALKGLGKRTTTVEDEEGPRKGPITPGRATTPRSSPKEIPKGMKTLDFLMAGDD